MSSKKKPSDQEILEGILAGGASKEKYVNYLYDNAFPGLINKIKGKLHLSEEDIRDAYTDAVVKLVEQILKQKFRGEAKLSSYFYRIFYNKGVDILRKRSSHGVEYLPVDETIPQADPAKNILDLLEVKDDVRKIQGLLQKLNPKCRQILLLFYEGYSMEEIAEKAELKNAESATSQKYKCFKKLMSFVKQGWH